MGESFCQSMDGGYDSAYKEGNQIPQYLFNKETTLQTLDGNGPVLNLSPGSYG